MGKSRTPAKLRLDARPGGKDIVRDILEERGNTYGPFIHNATTAQELKAVVRRAPNWDELTPDMKEALDLILSKVARAVTSSCSHMDNWDDIAGYAMLVADRLRGAR